MSWMRLYRWILQKEIELSIIAVSQFQIVTERAVAGCATGTTQFADVEAAARFLVETAKDFGRGVCSFYDRDEYAELLRRYGSLAHLQTTGNER